jgi:hypothetical protein
MGGVQIFPKGVLGFKPKPTLPLNPEPALTKLVATIILI